MNTRKLMLLVGVTGLIGAATPAQATWCWFGKCGGSSSSSSSGGSSSSSSGGHSSTSSGGSSTGGATPVPEPEQMGLFAMGVAVVGFRMFRARRNKK